MKQPNNIINKSAHLLGLATLLTAAGSIGANAEEGTPFSPSPNFYQVVSGQLNELDPNNGGYIRMGAKASSYNAAGYNVLDQYAYAWGRYAPFKNQLVRIHGDGSFVALGEPTPTGDKAPTYSIYAGDMDFEGNLWIRGDRFNAPDLMKIHVETNTYEMVRFEGVNPGSVADIVYIEHDGRGYFYGARKTDLYIWDVEARYVTKVPVTNLPSSSFGAAYTDADQALYVSSNSGGVHRILDYDTDKPRAVYLLDSVKTGNNDGFSNPKIEAPLIIPANQPPSINIVDDVVVKIDGMRIVLKPDITEDGLPFEGGGLAITWTQESGPSECQILHPTSDECEFRFPKMGVYTLRCNASDGAYDVHEDLFVSVGTEGVTGITTNAPRTDEYHSARDLWNKVKEELHCRQNGTLLEEEKRGFNEKDFYLQQDSEVIVTVIYDGGTFRNTLGWYDANFTQMERPIWNDFSTGPTAPLQVGSKASLGVLPAGTNLRFFLQQDGARGGDRMIYQDAERNEGGFEHIAARLFGNDDVERPLVIGFEDRELGGDFDYNDVIFQVEIITQSLGSAQYDNVIEGREGLNCDRGSRGVHQTLAKLGMQGAAYEMTSQLFEMPNETVSLEMIDDRSSMKFDLCAFDYDLVKHLDPSSLAFRVRAAEVAVSVMDDRQVNPGRFYLFDPSAHDLAGKTVGFIFVPNNTRSTFLRNPWRYTAKGNGERTKRQPLFTLNSANPGNLDQILSFQSEGLTVFALEDHTRIDTDEAGAESDAQFDDAILTFSPRLKPVDIFANGYYQGSEDVTIGYDGNDGHAPRGPGDSCCY